MLMLDKTLPHIGVLMEKPDPAHYPAFELPDGYTFCTYEEGMMDDWSRLQYGVGQIESQEEAARIFKQEFMPFPKDLNEKSVFVKDNAGTIVAAAMLWNGNHFGKTLQRLHWLAVADEHQGKGIGRALVTRVLELFQELKYEGSIYLTTQTWSYPAIAIYLQFGFRPYLGEKPENWKSVSERFQEENETAWKLIYDQIKTYYHNKK